MALTFGSVDDLLTALRSQEVRAEVDPSDLNLPGAWVSVERIRAVTVAGDLRLEVSVYLIVPDRDHRRAMGSLADLYNQVIPGTLTPDGPVVPTAVVLPDDPTPLPALRVPLFLHEPA